MATRALIATVEDLLALVGLLALGKQSPVLLAIVATIGNVLGSVTNWLLDRWIEHYRHRRWFPVDGRRSTGRRAGIDVGAAGVCF